LPDRASSALWEGALRDGKGRMSIGKGAYEGPYTFASRFESGAGTNPEELIAAAHAGCYSMALSAELEKAGHKPSSVSTTATVSVEPSAGGFAITKIKLETRASVPGIEPAAFQRIADGAKTGCPVSKALASVRIELDAKLA
jgi:osmotically inducible protein OsmC